MCKGSTGCNCNKYRFKVYTPEPDGYIRVNHRHLIVKGITTEGAHVDVRQVIDQPTALELMINDSDFCNVGNLANLLSANDMRNSQRHLIGELVMQSDITGSPVTAANGYQGFNKMYLSTLETPANYTGSVLMTVTRTATTWKPNGADYALAAVNRGTTLDGKGNKYYTLVFYSPIISAGFSWAHSYNGQNANTVSVEGETNITYVTKLAQTINTVYGAGMASIENDIILNIRVPQNDVYSWSTTPGNDISSVVEPITMEVPFVNGVAEISMPEYGGNDATLTYAFSGTATVKRPPLINSNIIYVGVLIENSNNVDN